MSFAENLKLIRKERNLSQEELAEILEVSRQAVSKWELGDGYPEVEKLLLLSSKLNISLDNLMSTEFAQKSSNNQRMEAGLITITSPYENVIVTCHKVMASGKMAGGNLTTIINTFLSLKKGSMVDFIPMSDALFGWAKQWISEKS